MAANALEVIAKQLDDYYIAAGTWKFKGSIKSEDLIAENPEGDNGTNTIKWAKGSSDRFN